jgi:hypothetical protein
MTHRIDAWSFGPPSWTWHPPATRAPRIQVFTEIYPGAAHAISQLADQAGGWHCETHPGLPWPHDDCPGPGMLP